MIKRLKGAIDSHWAKSRAFRIIAKTAFLALMAIPIFLLYWQARLSLGLSLGHEFYLLFLIAILIYWCIARKAGFVERTKQLSPKAYYYTRRVQCMACGGLLSGFGVLAVVTVLLGAPLPPPHALLLFLILIIVGAYIGDKLGKKRGWY